MVDSRNFKKQNQKGQGLNIHKWIPLVVIVVLALVLILIQYFMIDILMAVNTPDINLLLRTGLGRNQHDSISTTQTI